MTQTPDPDRSEEQPLTPPTPPTPPAPPPADPERPHGDPLTGHGERYSPSGYEQPGYGYPPGYAPNYNPYAGTVDAPYGYDPKTGLPYSDKSKLIAGILQIVIPLGIGRMYMGQTGMGVAQLLVTVLTCGVGAIWPFIDGILILVGDQRDADGRPLRS